MVSEFLIGKLGEYILFSRDILSFITRSQRQYQKCMGEVTQGRSLVDAVAKNTWLKLPRVAV